MGPHAVDRVAPFRAPAAGEQRFERRGRRAHLDRLAAVGQFREHRERDEEDHEPARRRDGRPVRCRSDGVAADQEEKGRGEIPGSLPITEIDPHHLDEDNVLSEGRQREPDHERPEEHADGHGRTHSDACRDPTEDRRCGQSQHTQHESSGHREWQDRVRADGQHTVPDQEHRAERPPDRKPVAPSRRIGRRAEQQRADDQRGLGASERQCCDQQHEHGHRSAYTAVIAADGYEQSDREEEHRDEEVRVQVQRVEPEP